ncbi:MAG: GatB/YqeY domain-containing protein [Chloroflexi bacterium]|nr:GatB/YqeY domain-containing protein [Chloroflexota bacterium]
MATEIEQKLTDELKDAMRSGDEVRRDAVRMLRAALKKEELDLQQQQVLAAAKKAGYPNLNSVDVSVLNLGAPYTLTDDDAVRVVNRQVKQHRESIDQFRKGNRADLAAREEAQLAVIEKYLPQLMPREQVEVVVRETLAGMDLSTGLKAQGAAMAALSPKLRGKADMKIVSEIVRNILTGAAG